MAGYYGYSKSNNAVEAENSGRYPLGAAIKIVAKTAGITQKHARELLNIIGSSEWHHTSKYYNKTQYYDVAVAVAYAKNEDDINKIQNSDARERMRSAIKGEFAERLAAIAKITDEISAELGVNAELITNVYYRSWDDLVTL